MELLDRIETLVRDGHYSILRSAMAQGGPAGARVFLEELCQLVREAGEGRAGKVWGDAPDSVWLLLNEADENKRHWSVQAWGQWFVQIVDAIKKRDALYAASEIEIQDERRSAYAEGHLAGLDEWSELEGALCEPCRGDRVESKASVCAAHYASAVQALADAQPEREATEGALRQVVERWEDSATRSSRFRAEVLRFCAKQVREALLARGERKT